MKRFIIKSLKFLLLPAIYLSTNIAINYYLNNNSNDCFKHFNTIIIGDSHAETSIDPSFFYNAVNYAKSAEPYTFTYYKLKKILKYTNPDTILISFSPHNLSAFNDLKYKKPGISHELFERGMFVLVISEIDNYIDINYQSYFKTIFRELALFPNKKKCNFLGEYLDSNYVNDIDDYELAIKRHFYVGDRREKIIGVSSTSIMYLDSIINLSRRDETKIILFSSPVHKNYYDLIPQKNLIAFVKCKERLKDSIAIIDRTKSNYDDSLFMNSDHLNSYGARVFTREVLNEISQFGK